jgi:hypothetical protein
MAGLSCRVTVALLGALLLGAARLPRGTGKCGAQRAGGAQWRRWLASPRRAARVRRDSGCGGCTMECRSWDASGTRRPQDSEASARALSGAVASVLLDWSNPPWLGTARGTWECPHLAPRGSQGQDDGKGGKNTLLSSPRGPSRPRARFAGILGVTQAAGEDSFPSRLTPTWAGKRQEIWLDVPISCQTTLLPVPTLLSPL